MNPAPEPKRHDAFDQGSSYQGTSLPDRTQSAAETRISRREAELVSNQRALETENRTLRELVLLLNTTEDREVARQMAEEISVRGLSDSLLARAQRLLAAHVSIVQNCPSL